MITKHFSKILMGGSIFLFIYVLIQTAWLCDDAFITFRTIDNFTNGYGLRWNIAERVQSYTHPLWMFLLSFFHLFTEELYYTSMIISIILSIGAIVWVALSAQSYWQAAVLIIILTFSKAFIDYSTSGLENSLSNFLIGAFIYIGFKNRFHKYQILWLTFLFSLILLCRLDYSLLLGPVWVGFILQYGKRKIDKDSIRISNYTKIFSIIFGLLPLIMWELFSLIYYGFLFPNTSYAKLWCPDISRFVLLRQGLFYVLNSLRLDSITLLTCAVAVSVTIFIGTKLQKKIAYGIVLYLLYVIWIGGDFMSGRFFATPFYLSVLLLIQIPLLSQKKISMLMFIIAIAIGLTVPRPTIFSTSTFGKLQEDLVDEFQIYNERLHYYPLTGLLSSYPGRLTTSRINQFRQNAEQNFWEIIVLNNIGLEGYLSARETYVVDYLGLGDPLLARLPALKPAPNEKMIAGHYPRLIPEGYLKSILQKENQIHREDANQLLGTIWKVTRGPIFSFSRFKEIFRLNMPISFINIKERFFQNPPQMIVQASQYDKQFQQPPLWFHPKNKLFSNSGIMIHFEKPETMKMIHLWLDSYNSYECTITFQDNTTQKFRLQSPEDSNEYLHQYEIQTENGSPVNSITLIPLTYINRYSFGAVN